eukprot:361497-Chlamydomonas_euryale.AAC.7
MVLHIVFFGAVPAECDMQRRQHAPRQCSLQLILVYIVSRPPATPKEEHRRSKQLTTRLQRSTLLDEASERREPRAGPHHDDRCGGRRGQPEMRVSDERGHLRGQRIAAALQPRRRDALVHAAGGHDLPHDRACDVHAAGARRHGAEKRAEAGHSRREVRHDLEQAALRLANVLAVRILAACQRAQSLGLVGVGRRRSKRQQCVPVRARAQVRKPHGGRRVDWRHRQLDNIGEVGMQQRGRPLDEHWRVLRMQRNVVARLVSHACTADVNLAMHT